MIENFTDTSGAPSCSSSLSPTGSAENVSTSYEYDRSGNLAKATDAEGSIQRYIYDALGRMIERKDGLSASELWTYDVRGNKLTLDGRISGSSDLVTWTYDGADRMLTRVADSVTTTYDYDANGNMTSASTSSPSRTIAMSHDRLDRLTKVDPDTGSTDTDYGYGFTSITRDDPTGSYSFGIDKWGRQTSMSTPAASGHTSAWRPDGLAGTSTDPNGTTTTRTYDDAGHLTTLEVKVGATTRASLTYAPNRAGLARTEAQTISGASSGNGTASFAYDHLGRLTGYDSPIGSTSDRDYAWAKVPDRTGVTADPSGTPATTTYTFDDADRITADSASGTYGTDASGRVTARPSRQFVWDSLGRLLTVKDGSGTTLVTYTYDPLDRLRTSTSGGTTLRYRYVGKSTSIAQIYDETAAAVDRNFANDLAERPVGSMSTSNTSPVSWIENAHHDIVSSTSSTGAVGRWYRYDPWGTLAASGGSGLTPVHRFQGSWQDLTAGLVWMVNRWYDPTTGRFLSEDSLLGEPRSPDSRHRYAYGEGDSINAWDPDGRASVRSSYVHGKDGSNTYSRSFANRWRVRGKILVSLYIREAVVDNIGFKTKGDGRGPGIDCKRSRACLAIDFTTSRITLKVNETCARPWRLPVLEDDSKPFAFSDKDCHPALPISFKCCQYSFLDVREGLFSLRVHVGLAQSFGPLMGFTPDTILTVMPFRQINLATDGFPSLYAMAVSPRGRNLLMNYREGHWRGMDGGPDVFRKLRWPTALYR